VYLNRESQGELEPIVSDEAKEEDEEAVKAHSIQLAIEKARCFCLKPSCLIKKTRLVIVC